MTLRQAGRLAAAGVLLKGLFYWIANVIPSWQASGFLQRVQLADLALIGPLVWSAYFFAQKNRVVTQAACALTLIELAGALAQQYSTLSLISIETMSFVFGTVLPAMCWALYLLGKRTGLGYLLLASLLQTAFAVFQVGSNMGMIRAFGLEEPWRLVIAPLIWIAYWATQTLFVRAAQKHQATTA